MKSYFKQYKPFLLFLTKFFVGYTILTFAYQTYLNQFHNKIDGITTNVTILVTKIANYIGLKFIMKTNPTEHVIIYHNIPIARVIEGCNVISIIILFITFIIAFSGKWKQTILYSIGGSSIIYILNIFRIILLTHLLYQYPAYKSILHDILFPLVIYGIVFTLWVIWVNKYALYASKNIK